MNPLNMLMKLFNSWMSMDEILLGEIKSTWLILKLWKCFGKNLRLNSWHINLIKTKENLFSLLILLSSVLLPKLKNTTTYLRLIQVRVIYIS